MLEQLVESSSGSHGGGRRGGFLLTTFVLVFALFFGGILWSLSDAFQKYFANGLNGGDLELSSLVAPVPVAEEEPPPPEEKKPEKQEKVIPNADVRKEIIQDVNESPKEPDKVSNEKSVIPPRRAGVMTVKGDTDSDAKNAAPSDYRGEVRTDNKGVTGPTTGNGDGDEDVAPPPKPKPTVAPTVAPTPPPVPKIVSGGVVNGKAVNLVKPPYPPAARAVHASGQVQVQVTIDENGSVISASAVSGHPLLKQAAEQAARSSKFSPTLLSGQKVKVSGLIVYNFTAQ